MGKGDKRRRCQVSKEVEEANWERIFGKKKLNIMSDDDRKKQWFKHGELDGPCVEPGPITLEENI
jgi:hypothetical protein